jgi:peptidoglycan hydrolase-like protein with peptidoglycan-binding domain
MLSILTVIIALANMMFLFSTNNVYAVSSPTPNPVSPPVSTYDPKSSLILSGSTVPKVKELQRDLIQLGYDIGPKGVDGIFVPDTGEAVLEYQADHSLLVDGKVGPQTWGSICSSLTSKATGNATGAQFASNVTTPLDTENTTALTQPEQQQAQTPTDNSTIPMIHETISTPTE